MVSLRHRRSATGIPSPTSTLSLTRLTHAPVLDPARSSQDAHLGALVSGPPRWRQRLGATTARRRTLPAVAHCRGQPRPPTQPRGRELRRDLDGDPLDLGFSRQAHEPRIGDQAASESPHQTREPAVPSPPASPIAATRSREAQRPGHRVVADPVARRACGRKAEASVRGASSRTRLSPNARLAGGASRRGTSHRMRMLPAARGRWAGAGSFVR
jgi:hypothetical protein